MTDKTAILLVEHLLGLHAHLTPNDAHRLACEYVVSCPYDGDKLEVIESTNETFMRWWRDR